MRRFIGLALYAASLALVATGCSAISDFDGYMFGGGTDSGPADAGGVDSGVDAGPVDGGPDGGPVDGGPVDGGEMDAGHDSGPRQPTGIIQTSGGATISTSEYQLQISIGAPQPMGHRTDGTSDLTVGPGSL